MRTFKTILLMFFVVGCTKPAGEMVLRVWHIVGVAGAGKGTIGQEISLTVSYPTASGCDIIERFDRVRQQDTIQITALGYTSSTAYCT